jgi:hypothetical protein
VAQVGRHLAEFGDFDEIGRVCLEQGIAAAVRGIAKSIQWKVKGMNEAQELIDHIQEKTKETVEIVQVTCDGWVYSWVDLSGKRRIPIKGKARDWLLSELDLVGKIRAELAKGRSIFPEQEPMQPHELEFCMLDSLCTVQH